MFVRSCAQCPEVLRLEFRLSHIALVYVRAKLYAARVRSTPPMPVLSGVFAIGLNTLF